MLYKKELLLQNFEENSEGESPEEFLKDRCKVLLNLWIEQRYKGYRLYKNTGPYWEVLKEVLHKYCPERFREFERIEGPFNENEVIKNEYGYYDDLLNFMAALQYADDWQQSMHLPNESHLVEISGKEYQYVPNLGFVDIIEEEGD